MHQNPKTDRHYEVCIFENLEDFVKCESERIFCMRHNNKFLLFTGVISSGVIMLYCYFLDSKPSAYLVLDKRTDTVKFTDIYSSDSIPIIFIKQNTLVQKILENYKERI